MNAIGDLSHKLLCSALIPRAKGFPPYIPLSPRPCLLCYFSILTMWDHPQLCYLQCLFQQAHRKCQKLFYISTTTLIQINTYEFLSLFCRNYSGAQCHHSVSPRNPRYVGSSTSPPHVCAKDTTTRVWVPLLVLPMCAQRHNPLCAGSSISSPHTCQRNQTLLVT